MIEILNIIIGTSHLDEADKESINSLGKEIMELYAEEYASILQ